MKYHVEVEYATTGVVDLTLTPEQPSSPEQVREDVEGALDAAGINACILSVNYAPDDDGIGYSDDSFSVLITRNI